MFGSVDATGELSLRGVRLILITVNQEPTVLAIGVAETVWNFEATCPLIPAARFASATEVNVRERLCFTRFVCVGRNCFVW